MFWVHGHCFPCPESAPQPDTGGRAENDSVPLCRSGKTASARLMKKNDDLSAYSARGDARLFLGNFEGSREDYEKMIQLNPKLERFPLETGDRLLLSKGIRQGCPAIQGLSQLRSSGSGEWNLAVHVSVQSKWSQYCPQGLTQVREGRSSALPLVIRYVCGKDQTRAGFSEIEKAEFDDLYKTRVLFHAWLS